MTRAFLDTNILIYLTTLDDQKYARSAEIVAQGGVISVQVLNEYCSVARRKSSRGWPDVAKSCEDFATTLEVQDVTTASQSLALVYADRYGYSIYDANILSSAKLAKCDILWSENMQHGQIIDGVQICNPFRDLPEV